MSDVRAWLEPFAAVGALIPASAVLAQLPEGEEPVSLATPAEPSWRERIWTVPSETRLTVAEVAEAFGRSESWTYKRTMGKRGEGAPDPLPCRRLDGSLVFLAGELRAWIRDHEESVVEGPSDPPSIGGAA